MMNRNAWYTGGSWTRWQSWCNLILGIILFIAPWYTVTWEIARSSWNAWIFGALTVLVALWAMAFPKGIIPPVINFLIGILVFISPWVLGYVAHTGMAWSAWIIGALVIILSAWAIAVAQRPGAPVGV